jgi:ATP-binding cassette, subfamily B, bacterial
MPIAQTRSTFRLCLRLLPYAVRLWPAMLAVFGVMLIRAALNLAAPWPMKLIVDYVIGSKPLPETVSQARALLPGADSPEGLLTWSVLATLGLFVLGWAVGLASGYTDIGFGQRMVYHLAADLFDHLQRLSLRFHSRKSVGDSIQRVMSDCSCVSDLVGNALLPVLASVLNLVSMFTIMWQLDPGLTLIALLVVPFMILTLWRFLGPMRDRAYERRTVEARYYGVVEGTLAAIPVVQAFSREDDADRELQASIRSNLEARVALASVQLQYNTLMGLATAGGTAAIVWLGAQHALDGTLTVGSILVLLAYLRSLYGPLQVLLNTPSTIQFAAGSMERVVEVLEVEREVADRPGAPRLPPARGQVQLEGVTFGYEAGRPALRNISLEVAPGETVAIVGPTGAGKTTLVSLIPRFFDPWQGRVSVDGRDVREVQLKSLRRQVALVLQEPFLLPISIGDNIAYGRPDAARPAVEAAAQAANAHAFIERLPAGYDTVVGERGATLSGGERQRIAIARALLKDAPILILDEPTSALDAETEGLLLEALERLMVGRTTLIIAHRLSTVRWADRIVVLRDGAIVEQGSHAALLAQDGLYARFHRIQAADPRAPAAVGG